MGELAQSDLGGLNEKRNASRVLFPTSRGDDIADQAHVGRLAHVCRSSHMGCRPTGAMRRLVAGSGLVPLEGGGGSR
jgi:hypothetical protein